MNQCIVTKTGIASRRVEYCCDELRRSDCIEIGNIQYKTHEVYAVILGRYEDDEQRIKFCPFCGAEIVEGKQ